MKDTPILSLYCTGYGVIEMWVLFRSFLCVLRACVYCVCKDRQSSQVKVRAITGACGCDQCWPFLTPYLAHILDPSFTRHHRTH